MSDDGPQNDSWEPVTHKVEIKVTAKAAVELDAVLITLEDQLAPIFSEMGMARLYRISQGENIPVPGGYSGSQKAVQLIA